MKAIFYMALLCLTLSSCSKEQSANTHIDSVESFLKDIDAKEQHNFTEDDTVIDRESADKLIQKWRNERFNKSVMSLCSITPDCPLLESVTETISVGTCEFTCSYKVYNCDSGEWHSDIWITDFEFTPIPGSNCNFYDILVTQNLNEGDLDEYQKSHNAIAARILSQIEDNLLSVTQQNPINPELTITTVVPNICAVECQFDQAQEECGQDCCIRIAQFTDERTSTSVFSSAECGGNGVQCDIGMSECQNFECSSLNYYPRTTTLPDPTSIDPTHQ